jgi:RimJ/RimL family protein N-acetyltransferase
VAATSVLGQAGRFRRAVRRYGARGTAQLLIAHVTALVYARKTHVWYALRLDEELPLRELPEPLRLVEAEEQRLHLLDSLWAIDHDAARQRLRSGGTLWFVLDGDVAAFSCWTFVGRTPVVAARGGWLELPADTAALEETMTSPAYRGRSIAPAAWTAIAETLRQRGLRRLVTAVDEENLPSRTAVGKIGFAEIGRMRSTRRGLRFRVRVELGDAAEGAFLRALER